MTPLPKRKLSKARQGKRRASIKLKTNSLSICPNCRQPVKPHTVCANCGMYKGKQVINSSIKHKK